MMNRFAAVVMLIFTVVLFNAGVQGSVTCPGDVSDGAQAGEDFDVNVFDLLLLLDGWTADAPGAEIADPNDVVDVFDLLELLSGWGQCLFVPGDVCAHDEFGTARCQLSDGTGQGTSGVLAAASDPIYGFIVADDFRVETTGVLTTVCWYGVYADFGAGTNCFENVTDDFLLKIYTGSGGSPSPNAFLELDIGDMTLNVDKVFTGDVLSSGNLSTAVFEYTYEIPAGQQVVLDQGQCYWLEISNAVAGDCAWLWVTAPPGDGFAMQRSAANPMYANIDQENYDLA